MTDAARKLTPLHAANGQFAMGNPGRPTGAVAKHSRTLLAQVKAMGPDAVQKLWEALMAGERWAVELVLSHVLPRDRALEWEGVEPADIREAVKSGDIGSDEAARLATALAKISEIEDLTTIRERLDELEQALRDAK
jgi:hypothetical protein